MALNSFALPYSSHHNLTNMNFVDESHEKAKTNEAHAHLLEADFLAKDYFPLCNC